jgi:predicted RNA-binding protein YlqC (UPF0109 family)
MKEFLHFWAQQLVSYPGQVDFRETAGGLVSILELRVAREDMGRLISKQGHTAQSLRVILGAVATRNHRKVQL